MLYTQPTEWVEYISNYRRRLSEIKVPKNVEPSQAKFILSLLDDVYAGIRLTYGDIMKQLDEADNLIDRIRKKAEVLGPNTEARKANGVLAVENAELGDGTSINLYNIRTALYYQKEDLEGLLAVIEKKQSLIITMSGLLKIESQIAGH